MKESENTYTSFDFMKIFGIKRGSWNNIKNKYNLDQYSEKIIEGKQTKFIYSKEAYDVLKQNYQQKVVKEVRENPKMFSLIQENETLRATLNEYKQISNKFETLYNEEKNNKESLLEKNAILQSTNSSYIKENHRLEGEKYELQQEIDRLKNRNFFARLFNK